MEAATPNQVLDIGHAWDKYWATIFTNNSYSSLIYEPEDLIKNEVGGLSNMDALTFYSTSLARSKSGRPHRVSAIYADGKEIVRKKVVEYGSGYGFSAQPASLFANRFLAIESSRLISDLMQRRNTEKLRFLHISETRQLHDLRGTFDTAIAMNVLVHQNYPHALALLRSANVILKRGGVLRANFCTLRPEAAPLSVFTADKPLNYGGITAGFWFDDEEISSLAKESGFELTELKIVPSLNLRVARFVKT